MIKWKKRIMIIAALMLIFSTTFASAQVMNLQSKPTDYYSYHDVKNGTVNKNSRMYFHKLNGNTVFCVEAGIGIRDINGDYFLANQENNLNVDLQQETVQNDEAVQRRIAYLGYYSKEDRNIQDYIFTQMLIWQSLPDSAANGIDSKGNYRSYFADEQVKAEYEVWKKEILEKIENWDQKPALCGQIIEIAAGQEVVLNDEASILKDYESFDYRKEGVRIIHEKGKNTLKVAVEESCKGGAIAFSEEEMRSAGAVKYPAIKEANYLFKHAKYQDMAVYGFVDSVAMSLAMQVTPVGKVEILKTGEGILLSVDDGKITLDTQERTLEGCVFEVSDEDGEVVEYLKTDKNGKCISRNLLAGKYYIKEIEAPCGFVKTEEVYVIEVTGGIATKEIFNPHQEVMFQVQKNFINYPYEDISKKEVYEKISFGLFADNVEMIAQGSLIEELKPDEQGTIRYVGYLPEGQYYLKELTTHEKYVKDETEYFFGVQYDDSGSEVIEVEINGGNAIFNEYVEIPKEPEGLKVPQTGDSNRLSVSLIAGFVAGTLLMGIRRRMS